MLEGNKKLVTFADEDGWTALHHAAYHQFDSILDAIIEAQIEVGHEFVYKHRDLSTPFHVAAEKGYTFTVIRLMELWPTWSSAYTDVNNDGRNILHLAATQSEKEMIQGILKYCPEKYKNQIVNAQDNNGDTPLHLLIMLGCFVPELIKCKGLHTMTKNKSDHTPLDYFYLEDGIIADQVCKEAKFFFFCFNNSLTASFLRATLTHLCFMSSLTRTQDTVKKLVLL